MLGTAPFKTLKYCGLKTNVLEENSFVVREKKLADQPFENKGYLGCSGLKNVCMVDSLSQWDVTNTFCLLSSQCSFFVSNI